MLIFKNATPVLQVTDVARSIAWSSEVLGFAADPFPDAPPYAFAILVRDRAEIMLQCVESKPAELTAGEPRRGWSVYLRLKGENLLALFEEVQGRTTILRRPERTFYNEVEFEVADPDGHRVCVAEALPSDANVPMFREGKEEGL